MKIYCKEEYKINPYSLLLTYNNYGNQIPKIKELNMTAKN